MSSLYARLSSKHQSMADKFIPRWAAELRMHSDPDDLPRSHSSQLELEQDGLALHSASCCFVGEAHGFSPLYDTVDGAQCRDCIYHSYNLTAYNVDYLLQQIGAFLDHFAKHHARHSHE